MRKEELLKENLEWLDINGGLVKSGTFCYYNGYEMVEIIKVNNIWTLKE